jgi:hypothetical protein
MNMARRLQDYTPRDLLETSQEAGADALSVLGAVILVVSVFGAYALS